MAVELTAEERARLQDIDAFNASIAESGWQVKDKVLRDNLSRIRLVNSTLEGVEAINVAWREAELRDTRFTGATLTLCDFGGARLRNVTFTDCVFKSATFSTAQFAECRFVRCRVELVKARDAGFERCAFENWEDIGGVYGGSKFEESTFVNSRFDDTSVQVAELNRVQMKGCQFRSVIFGQIRGTNLIFEGSGLDHCGFVDSEFGNIAVDRCVLRAVTFDHFAVAKALVRNCGAIQAMTILDSVWQETLVSDCAAVTDLTMDRASLRNWSLSRCQVGCLRVVQSRVGAAAIADCQLVAADFGGTEVLRMRMERTGILQELSLERAAFGALTLTDVTYAEGVEVRGGGVRYGEGSARFPGGGE